MATIRQEIPITSGRVGDYSSLNTQNSSVGTAHINESSYYDGGVFYYELVAKNVNTTTDYTIYLRNWSGDAIISSIVVPKNTTNFTIFRSLPFVPFPGGADVYTNIPQTTSNSDVVIRVSRVVVVVTANPIVRNETQIDIGAHESAKSNTAAAPLAYPKYWYYDSSKWDGGCVFSAEVSLMVSSTKGTVIVTLQEDNGSFGTWTDKVTIANAVSPSLYQNYRAVFLPTTGRNYRISAYISSSKYTYNISRASVIVDQFPGYPGYSYTGTNTKLANPTTLPPGNATLTAWDPSNTYLAVSSDTSNYLRIYKRTTDTFTALTPSAYPTSAALGCAFDPTGTYLAVGLNSSPYFLIYKRSGDTFTLLTTPLTTPPTALCGGVKFSPDGNYVSFSTTATPYIWVYKKNAGLDTWTKISNLTAGPSLSNTHCWSDDSRWLAVVHSATPYLSIYQNNMDDTFTRLSNPATTPTGYSRGCSFSHDNDISFLAVGHDTTPFVTVYKRDGTTFTKMTNPATLPVTGGRGIDFMNLNQSKDCQIMVVTGQGSPYIWAYTVSTTQILSYIPSPTTLPAGITSSAAFTSDNQYMAVPNAVTSPFVTIYKRADSQYFSKFETQYELLNFNSATTGDQSVMTTYDPAEWAGVTQNYYAEHNGTAASSNTKIRNKTDSTDITNSNITGTNRVRGASALTMPTSKKDLDANIIAS